MLPENYNTTALFCFNKQLTFKYHVPQSQCFAPGFVALPVLSAGLVTLPGQAASSAFTNRMGWCAAPSLAV